MYQTESELPRQTNPDFPGPRTQGGRNLMCTAQKLDGSLKETH